MRARRTCWAGCDPVRTSRVNLSRSAGLSATGRDFDLDIIDSLLTGWKGKGPATSITPQQPRQLAATRY